VLFVVNSNHLFFTTKSTKIGIDEIENLYPDPSDWTVKQCREHLDDYGHGHPDPDPWAMDREDLARFYNDETGDALDDVFCSPEWETADAQSFVACAIDEEDIDGLDDWRDAVRDTDPQEVFEWWLVSDWLAVSYQRSAISYQSLETAFFAGFRADS
jgi:hypothetical protein